MSTKFLMTRDIGGQNGFGVDFCDDGEATTLTANAAQTVTVPSNYPNWLAIFSISPGSDVWVNKNGTATLPGSSFAPTTSELNPIARRVAAGDTLSLITASTLNPYVKVSFYVIPFYGN